MAPPICFEFTWQFSRSQEYSGNQSDREENDRTIWKQQQTVARPFNIWHLKAILFEKKKEEGVSYTFCLLESPSSTFCFKGDTMKSQQLHVYQFFSAFWKEISASWLRQCRSGQWNKYYVLFVTNQESLWLQITTEKQTAFLRKLRLNAPSFVVFSTDFN